MFWNKNSDWLSLENAKANVKFWEEDLQYAQDYVEHLEKSNNKSYSGWKKMYKIALKDVLKSKEGLAFAQFKLKESEALEEIFS